MEERHRILLIDDEVDLCLLLKTYFLRKNYEVYISHSVSDALLRVKDIHPKFIYLGSSTCYDLDEDKQKLKEAAPTAEILVGNNRLPDQR